MHSRTSVLRRTILTLGTLASIACGDGGPPMTDAGPIVVVDSGETPDTNPPDAFAPPDAGDGVCGDSLSPTGWAQMPASCLPRCTHDTAVAVDACRTATDYVACAQPVLRADPTPVAHVRTQGGFIRDVTCGGSNTEYSCLEWQVYSCYFDNCPDGYATWVNCLAGGGACTAEQDAVSTCAQANAGWTACVQTRIRACYP